MRRFDLRSLSFGRDDTAWRRLPVEVDPFILGGERYEVPDDRVDLSLTASRVGSKLVLQAEFSTRLHGACARCLEDVDLPLEASGADYVADGDSQGVAEGEEPYVRGYQLAADRWARDLLADALPAQLLCREDCRGLCAVCGVNLNEAGEQHTHDEAAGA
jgi:uncharacterized protein